MISLTREMIGIIFLLHCMSSLNFCVLRYVASIYYTSILVLIIYLLAVQRYEKPGCNSTLALRKMRRTLNNRQQYAFSELYNWRDEVARDKDESISYVLPTHML